MIIIDENEIIKQMETWSLTVEPDALRTMETQTMEPDTMNTHSGCPACLSRCSAYSLRSWRQAPQKNTNENTYQKLMKTIL